MADTGHSVTRGGTTNNIPGSRRLFKRTVSVGPCNSAACDRLFRRVRGCSSDARTFSRLVLCPAFVRISFNSHGHHRIVSGYGRGWLWL